MVKICPKCNMKNSNNSDYCVNCSNFIKNVQTIVDEELDSTIDDHYDFKPEKSSTPILVSYFGAGFLIAGLVILAFFGIFMYSVLSTQTENPNSPIYNALFGTLFFTIAIFCFYLSYGLWKGKYWAWKVIVISIFLQILLGIIFFNVGIIITLIISIIVLALLFRPSVRMYFDLPSDKKQKFPIIKIIVFLVLIAVVYISLFVIFSLYK